MELRLARMALGEMKAGRVLSALALVGVQGVALRRECKVIVDLYSSGRVCDAVAFSAFLPRSPWILKVKPPERKGGEWGGLDVVLRRLLEGSREPKVLEAFFGLKREAPWPVVRFLRELGRDSGTGVEDLAFAVEWVWRKREAWQKVGLGVVNGPFVGVRDVG